MNRARDAAEGTRGLCKDDREELKRLHDEVAELRMERDVLKRDPRSCGQGGDEVSVTRFVADQRTMYRVPHTVVCALLGVSLARFYQVAGPR